MFTQSLNCGRDPEPVEAFIRNSAQANKRVSTPGAEWSGCFLIDDNQ
jgi:hypothetical protein